MKFKLNKRTQLLITIFFLLIIMGINLLFWFEKEGNAKTVNEANHTWLTDIQEAKDLGKMQHRIILVDLYAKWCEPCKMYEDITFQDLKVQDSLKKIIKVRLQYDEKTPSNSSFINDFKVLGLPTIIFLSPEGEEIINSRIEGFLNPKEFLLHLNNIYEKLA